MNAEPDFSYVTMVERAHSSSDDSSSNNDYTNEPITATESNPKIPVQLTLDLDMSDEDQRIQFEEKASISRMKTPAPTSLSLSKPPLPPSAAITTNTADPPIAKNPTPKDDDNLLISKLPDQRRNIISKRGACFTLMVAGESGLGKTTFINTLFGDSFRDANRPRNDGQQVKSADGDPQIEFYEKTTKIEIQEAVYEERGFKTHFTVIDTPGFGDYTNNNNSWVPIVNYIDEQHRIYMLREEQPDRSKLVDTRVHACLYFIRPSGHGLLQLDIKAMQELSSRVNLIPIISKADSFSHDDCEKFKRAIGRDIDLHNINVYRPPNSTSNDPFAIISSENMVENETGELVRGRKYRWGVAEVDNEKHCDFAKLRQLLMTEHMLNLIDTTIENHCSSYRKKTMLQRIDHYNNAQTQQANKISEASNGLDILKAIHAYGREYLQNGLLEHDPIFTEKKNRTSERFDIIVSFQEKKFEQWRAELKAKQDEYNAELEQLHSDILKLQTEVDMLEYNHPPNHHSLSLSNNNFGHHHHHHYDHVENNTPKDRRSTKYTIRG